MKLPILDRYIARHVITMILMVTLALWGLDVFFGLVNELKVVGRGSYTLSSAFFFLLLTSPTRLYAMFPWAALIGTLISMGMLANHRELVVMRTATLSVARISWAVIKAALWITFFLVLFGEGLAPLGEKIAQAKKTLALSGGQSIQTGQGMWVRNGPEFIHIKTILADGRLMGVTRYHFDENRKLQEVIIAKTAEKKEDGWHLENIEGTRFLENKTETIPKSSLIVPDLIDNQLLETAAVKHPERLSLPLLWHTIQERSKNELNAQAYELAFWNKVFQPILIVLMVFLAVPFVFGPLRSASMGLRILVGIFVAYLFHTLNGLFAPLALVYQMPPFFAVLSPFLVFGIIGTILLKTTK